MSSQCYQNPNSKIWLAYAKQNINTIHVRKYDLILKFHKYCVISEIKPEIKCVIYSKSYQPFHDP